MASSAPLSAGKSILKDIQAAAPQTASNIDSGTKKLGAHHVTIDFSSERHIPSEQSDTIQREREVHTTPEQSVDVFTVSCSNYQSVVRPSNVEDHPKHFVAVNKKFLHYDAEAENYYFLAVNDDQRVEKKEVKNVKEVPGKPSIIKLTQKQILEEKWRIFVIADELAPDSLVALEPKPIASRKTTIQVHPFSPQELKACFKAIRMEPWCFCLQRDQWGGTAWRDVLNMWITEIESFRKRPTSYCSSTGSVKAIIYMALTYYACQKDSFEKELSDTKKNHWDRIDNIYHCIFKTLHHVIQFHTLETSIPDAISTPATINASLIEQNLPLQFHYYTESIIKKMKIYISEKNHKHFPPFLERVLAENDSKVLFVDNDHSSMADETIEPQMSSPDHSPTRQETAV